MWDVGSSWARARTRVPCIGRQILNHCTTREAPEEPFLCEQSVRSCFLSWGHLLVLDVGYILNLAHRERQRDVSWHRNLET